MTSIAPSTRSEIGNVKLSMRELEASPSSSSRPNILPLGIVSPDMSSPLIDELMRVIEEQAEVKLVSSGNAIQSQGEPHNAPLLYDQKDFYKANGQTRHTIPTSVVYSTASQRNGAISQAGSFEPPPLNFSRNRESSSVAANAEQSGLPSTPGSKFILTDQTQEHPLQIVESQEPSRDKTNHTAPQIFPARLDSIQQGERHSRPPSITSRRHSTDANHSYMSFSDTTSVHDIPQNSILNYKKWIGNGKTGSRVTSQKPNGPTVVAEKSVKAKAPTISKSKSFFSHFKYEMHPTPMYYVAEKKTPRPGSQNKGSKRFSMDGSSSNANSLRKQESGHKKSSHASIKGKDMKEKSSSDDHSKWSLSPSSRGPPHVPLVESPAPKQQGSLISQLAWDTIRVPIKNNDFQDVEGWLAGTQTEHSSPIYPLSPVFSGKGIASTAATSPAESHRLSVVFEDRNSANPKERANKMQSRIISWVDLEGCTPEFVQSLQVLGIVEGVEPALTPVGGEEVSISNTPSSKYAEKSFAEFQKSDSEFVFLSTDPPETASAFPIAPANLKAQSPPTIRSRSNSQSSFKKSKPQPTPLIIPTSSSYSIFPAPPKSLSTHSSREGLITTTISYPPQKTNYDSGDSPTLPTPMSISLLRSTKRVKRRINSPPTPSASFRNRVEQPKEESPPPIPQRLRPIVSAQPSSTTSFLAPSTGLVLSLSRQYISQTKSSWEIVAPPSKTPLLTCIAYPLTRTLLFSHPATQNHLFTFTRRDSSSWVATCRDNDRVDGHGSATSSQPLFCITESVFGRWIITVPAKANPDTDEVQTQEKKYEVRVDDLDEGREMEVLSSSPTESGEEVCVGKVLAKGRNVYKVKVMPGCDFAVMSCLTVVFDEWRVDEGFF